MRFSEGVGLGLFKLGIFNPHIHIFVIIKFQNTVKIREDVNTEVWMRFQLGSFRTLKAPMGSTESSLVTGKKLYKINHFK